MTQHFQRPIQDDPDFDAAWYVLMYPEVSSFDVTPDEHYRVFGKQEGRHPTKTAYEKALGFDRQWYLQTNPDVAQAGIDPFEHYIAHGQRERRHANAHFSFTPRQLEVLSKAFHLPDATQTQDTPASISPFVSKDYWSDRYRSGGNSGAGSYGRLARFKADILNAFIKEQSINNVIEFGCGDGAQLKLADYPQYLGVDVTAESIRLCQELFKHDSTKSFVQSSSFNGQTADVSLSLDVIFHLIEDHVFHQYMSALFRAAKRYVIIYSSNRDDEQAAAHVMHRRFSDWIDIYHADFQLIRCIPNPYPPRNDPQNESFADFYIYERQIQKTHQLPGELIVSLTSYLPRFPTLELTLRRILQQSIRADKTILWVSSEDHDHLPAGVLELQANGLSILITDDSRSYKKIVPALRAFPTSYIITLDDDTAYPLDVVEHLAANHRQTNQILCRRAHRVHFGAQGEVLPYNRWQFETEEEFSVPNLFPTGVGGVLYPPRTLHPEVMRQDVFSALAPVNDDVWLYWMAWRAGSTVRRVGPNYLQQPWPGCHDQGLWTSHNASGGNDAAILALSARYGSPFGDGHCPVASDQLRTHSPLSILFKRHSWSAHSRMRNELTCQYEPLQPFVLLELMALAKSRIFIDIGANIGAYSVLCSQAPAVEEIHAFEIEEAAFRELRANIYMNSLEEVITPHFVAVSDKNGEVIFGVARPMAGHNGVIDTSFHSQDVYVERRVVGCTSLDSQFNYSNESIAFKIDIEGHELQALVGGSILLSRNRCIIQIEIYESIPQIRPYLEQIGYRLIFSIGPDHYFSNIRDLFDAQTVLDAVSSSMGVLVECSLRG